MFDSLRYWNIIIRFLPGGSCSSLSSWSCRWPSTPTSPTSASLTRRSRSPSSGGRSRPGQGPVRVFCKHILWEINCLFNSSPGEAGGREQGRIRRDLREGQWQEEATVVVGQKGSPQEGKEGQQGRNGEIKFVSPHKRPFPGMEPLVLETLDDVDIFKK